jgi:hypothetical protein
MNRLTNYFESVKLAKLHLMEAKQADNHERRIWHQMRAIEYLLTAMNNVASIAFKKKPRK